jgi:hypothetical protein
MRPQSAKAKGRRFQQFVRDLLLRAAESLEEDDIRSTSMGASGEDILFSPAARKIYPYSIECKNVERLNIWDAIKQAKDNCKKYIPMVIFKKNNHEAWVAIPLSDFMKLQHNYED